MWRCSERSLAGVLLLASALWPAGVFTGCSGTASDMPVRQVRLEAAERKAAEGFYAALTWEKSRRKRALAERDDLRRQLRDARAEADRLRRALDTARRQTSLQDAPEPGLRAPDGEDIEKLKARIAELTREIAQLRHQMAAVRARYQVEITRLRKVIEQQRRP